MLFFGILSILLTVASLVAATSADNCYNEVENLCKNIPTGSKFNETCNATHGQILKLQSSLQEYANYNLLYSFDYLLLSSHFGNYDAHREGFKALYRKLSDQCWEDTISVLKYLAKRGGKAVFNKLPHHVDITKEKHFDLDEINSLSKALDMQKELADEASRIHSEALRFENHNYEDAGIIHYLQEQFVEPLTDRIRDLAGYTNDLKGILSNQDASIGVFLFDEYLKKSLN